MPISFVGSYVGTHAATSAQSIALSNLRDASNAQPTLLQGDVVVVVYVHAMATTANRTLAQCTPSGYTNAHASIVQANDSNAVSMAVSYKVMGSTPDANVSIPAAAATTNGVAYAIYAFRGVDASVLDVTSTTASASNTGVANAPSITPSGGGAWIMACGGAAVAAGAAFTNPTGMSATTNHFRSATITTTTNDANVGVALKTDWASGAYDTAAFGGSTSTNTGSWGAVTLALKQLGVAGSLSVTESGSDSFDASGTVTDPSSTGTLAATESGSDTASMAGGVGVAGSLIVSDSGSDSISGAGTVTVSGSAAATETGADSASSAGLVAVSGSAGATEAGSDSFTGSGTAEGSTISGSLEVTESGQDGMSLSGMALLEGLLASTEDHWDVIDVRMNFGANLKARRRRAKRHDYGMIRR